LDRFKEQQLPYIGFRYHLIGNRFQFLFAELTCGLMMNCLELRTTIADCGACNAVSRFTKLEEWATSQLYCILPCHLG
jgi:hypothetical protein